MARRPRNIGKCTYGRRAVGPRRVAAQPAGGGPIYRCWHRRRRRV